jgi:GNAT superfamily N-acetyltransferase
MAQATVSMRTRGPFEYVRADLPDGGRVTLRPLRHGEADPVLEVFEGLSELSRARRFLTGMSRLPPGILASLVDVDGHDHVAWVASVDGCPVGIGRYARMDEMTAEVAFEVVDTHHGRGLGSVLADTIATLACANGFTRLTATVAPDNDASVRILAGLGLTVQMSDGLLEGDGRLRLPEPSRVRRGAVLARARRGVLPMQRSASYA